MTQRTNVVVEKDGQWKWYASTDPEGQGTATAATALPLVNDTASLNIPSGKPEIVYDRAVDPNKIVIKDNGAALSDALLLQLSPGNYSTTGTNAFQQDLTASGAMNSKIVKDGTHVTVATESTVASTTLGTNWLTEKNIVIPTPRELTTKLLVKNMSYL